MSAIFGTILINNFQSLVFPWKNHNKHSYRWSCLYETYNDKFELSRVKLEERILYVMEAKMRESEHHYKFNGKLTKWSILKRVLIDCPIYWPFLKLPPSCSASPHSTCHHLDVYHFSAWLTCLQPNDASHLGSTCAAFTQIVSTGYLVLSSNDAFASGGQPVSWVISSIDFGSPASHCKKVIKRSVSRWAEELIKLHYEGIWHDGVCESLVTTHNANDKTDRPRNTPQMTSVRQLRSSKNKNWSMEGKAERGAKCGEHQQLRRSWFIAAWQSILICPLWTPCYVSSPQALVGKWIASYFSVSRVHKLLITRVHSMIKRL
jgi:hypothetical protein